MKKACKKASVESKKMNEDLQKSIKLFICCQESLWLWTESECLETKEEIEKKKEEEEDEKKRKKA